MANNPVRDLINVVKGTRRDDSPLVVDGDGKIDALDVTTLSLGGTALSATADELNRAADVSSRIVDITASSDDLTVAEHDGKVVTLNRAGGIDLTLPAATGSGAKFLLLVKTTVTDDYIINASNACDAMIGSAMVHQDCANTVVSFDSTSGDHIFTMNGDTTGGLAGSWVEFTDIATDTWFVRASLIATGCEATPFST